MKLSLKTIKPRNPFVAASLRRSAGVHGPGPGARRQQAERALRQEVKHLEGRHRRPSP
ncbi:MAG: hypothetical protein Q8K45_17655 [Rubrivivax sp.]|nr:hypothetical protein [Rubrivivax sp.]